MLPRLFKNGINLDNQPDYSYGNNVGNNFDRKY